MSSLRGAQRRGNPECQRNQRILDRHGPAGLAMTECTGLPRFARNDKDVDLFSASLDTALRSRHLPALNDMRPFSPFIPGIEGVAFFQ